MLTQLWTGLSGKLSERLLAALFSPALAFWATGVLAWSVTRDKPGSWAVAVRRDADAFANGPIVVQIAAAVGAVAVLIFTGRMVGSLALPTLRLMEGYWPARLHGLRRRLAARVTRRQAAAATRWRELQRSTDELTAEELAELVRLDRRLRRVPLLEQQHMPTRLGNVLRSSETRPARKYGLDPVVCWSQLWLLLPDTVRAEVTAARARLDLAASAVVWGALIIGWTPWTLWALPVAFATGVGGYVAAVRAAGVFGDLVEAAWDLHRGELYRAVRWPLPANPAEEYAAGRALTSYLRRGSRGQSPTFT